MTNIPGSFVPVQQEATFFNNPVGESTQIVQGAVLNQMLQIWCPVGTVISSILTESQFQTSLGNPLPATWILADGRDVTGSRYETLTGSSTVVNLSGVFLRGKNNGRADGFQNPNGDLPLGTYTADTFRSHQHTFGVQSGNNLSAGTSGRSTIYSPTTFNIFSNSSATGGNETAPKNLTLNHFIRIN